MTQDEAWKEFGYKYAGPNLEAKFKEILTDYDRDKCKEMCAMVIYMDVGGEAEYAVMETNLPDFD